LLRYEPNDLVGRTGVEALAEPVLRGKRGVIVRRRDQHSRHQATPSPVATCDDRGYRTAAAGTGNLSPRGGEAHDKPDETYELHGAAVVIDVAHRAGARRWPAYPAYVSELLDQTYAQLSVDRLNQPLLNLATMTRSNLAAR